MFLGLTYATWITIASVVVPLVLHVRSTTLTPTAGGGVTASGGLPLIGSLLNALLGLTTQAPAAPAPATAPVGPLVVVPASPTSPVPVLANHPLLNDLLNAALKVAANQLVSVPNGAANPAASPPVVTPTH